MRDWWGLAVAAGCIASLCVILVGFIRDGRTGKGKRKRENWD